MKLDSLLGVWTGITHTSNGWDTGEAVLWMKIIVSILQPVEIGATLGVFDIPMIPCSGVFKVIDIDGEILELQAEKLQGDCEAADYYSLELLPDGTLLYVSKGSDWETRGVLQRAN